MSHKFALVTLSDLLIWVLDGSVSGKYFGWGSVSSVYLHRRFAIRRHNRLLVRVIHALTAIRGRLGDGVTRLSDGVTRLSNGVNRLSDRVVDLGGCTGVHICVTMVLGLGLFLLAPTIERDTYEDD